MELKRKKEVLDYFDSLVLNKEEFLKKVKTGDHIYGVTSIFGAPETIDEFQIISYKNDNEIECYCFFKTGGKGSGIIMNKSISDFFHGCKCVFLSEEEAYKALDVLNDEFNKSSSWYNDYMNQRFQLEGVF